MEHRNCKAEGAAASAEPALKAVLPETQSSLPLKKMDLVVTSHAQDFRRTKWKTSFAS